MSVSIPTADRITNATAVPDESDKTAWNANNVMLILDKLFNGEYKGFKLPVWTTDGRPETPELGMVGINSDSGHMEFYDGSSWQPLNV